jgi:hypothetical protein
MNRLRERAEHLHALDLIASIQPITTRPATPDLATSADSMTLAEYIEACRAKYGDDFDRKESE